MKRYIITVTVALVVFAAAAPAAQANHLYLSAGLAARTVGHALHTEFNGIQRGSLDADCPAWPGRRDYRFCTYTYFTQRGACWRGSMGIRYVTPTWISYRMWSDRRCHGYR